MNAVGYCRVSSTQQAEDGVSLDAQAAKLRAWATLNECQSITIFTDAGLSGGRADNRPALQQALAAVKKGDVLVVYSLSRLARSVKDTLAIGELLDKRGADLASLSERIETSSASGKMIFRLLAVMSEFERDMVSERTSMALAHKRSKSEYTGGKVPYGFTSENGRLVKDAKEQEGLALIAEMQRTGYSLRTIAEELTSRGFVTKNGGEWFPSTVQAIIRRKK